MRLAILTAGLLAGFTSLAAAQGFETPEALLEAFYEPYFTGEFYDDESVFRSAALQSLYDADAQSTPPGEMGALSFDPYIDGQDYELTELTFTPLEVTDLTAIVDVEFLNFDEPKLLTYELVYEDGWVIDDVVSANPENLYRLSDIFLEAGGF